ncbi:MAG: hypothetical protein ACK5PW_22600 [Burkholderiales bacterium]|jgi:tripartite-type tricarboxylate transporter receptor subunit TctC
MHTPRAELFASMAGAVRAPSAPELPTVADAAGLAGYEATAWNALFAPAGSGTPAALGAFLGREIDKWRGVVQRANVKVD